MEGDRGHDDADIRDAPGRASVSMLAIKSYALKLEDCALRDVLLAEKDQVTAEEFALKLPVFLRLLGRVD